MHCFRTDTTYVTLYGFVRADAGCDVIRSTIPIVRTALSPVDVIRAGISRIRTEIESVTIAEGGPEMTLQCSATTRR
jgi:hypothetical protein